MTHSPRQSSAQSATHLARLRCRHLKGDRYVCRGVLGDGMKLYLDVVVSRDGKFFRYARR